MSTKSKISWEEAVSQFRNTPGHEQAVLDNYFDLPVIEAVRRFSISPEAREILRLLSSAPGRVVLDLGAGNGIGSYALAKAGWNVSALEPDSSMQVGTGAIREWARAEAIDIQITEEVTLPLPFPDEYFSAIFGRQVIHHLPNLRTGIADLHRLLRPGGLLLATRDHVVNDEHQLAQFLDGHPLHRQYGGENAFSLDAYLSAYRSAGFEILQVFGPLSSILNFYPGTESERKTFIRDQVSARLGRFAKLFQNALLAGLETRLAEHYYQPPGRIYSFLLRKR